MEQNVLDILETEKRKIEDEIKELKSEIESTELRVKKWKEKLEKLERTKNDIMGLLNEKI